LAGLTEDDVESAFEVLADEARGLLRETSPAIERAVDAKYAGQSFELTIQLPDPRTPVAAIAEIFAREHEHTYGHRADADPVQIVNVRIVARIPRDDLFRPAMPRNKSSMKGRFSGSMRNAYFGQHHGIRATPALSRFELRREEPRAGPLLIDEYDATTLVPLGCSARLDHCDNIVIRIEA
jgi:N-methylhydantoinase A